MDLQAAERLASVADPSAIKALQRNSHDPTVKKAVAEQFGTLLMTRVMQHADGSAIAMADGVGSGPVNSMFADTIAQATMSGDRLGLADLLFRSMGAPSKPPTGAATTAAPANAPTPASPAGAASPGSGLPLAPYWQDHGLRPPSGAPLHSPVTAPPLPTVHGANPTGHFAPPAARAVPVATPSSPPATDAAVPSGSPAPAPASSAAAPTGSGHASGEASLAQMTYFARRLGPLIEQAAKRLGVSARVLLAQAALETGWGRAIVGNNLFGVKASAGWSGGAVTAATHEVEAGRSVAETAAFRAYGTLAESVHDFVSLVAGSRRYQAALGTGDDARSYAQALIKSGYASDGNYPAKLAAVAASPAIKAAFAGPIPLLPPNFAPGGSVS